MSPTAPAQEPGPELGTALGLGLLRIMPPSGHFLSPLGKWLLLLQGGSDSLCGGDFRGKPQRLLKPTSLATPFSDKATPGFWMGAVGRDRLELGK